MLRAVWMLLLLLSISTPGPAATPDTIIIDPSVTHQTIEGWGGNIYPQAVGHQKNDPTLYDKAFKELKTTHMRVRSFWYRLEAENDNDDPNVIDFGALKKHDTGIVHDEFLLQKAMVERDVKILFASWRFPFWMMGKPASWRPKSSDRPRFPAKMEAEYVESIAAYCLYARKEYGFTFEAISVANEPMLGIYVRHDAARLARLTKALKERLAKAKYETTFYCPDVTPGDMSGVRRARSFFAQKGVAEFSRCVAFHSYRPKLDGLRAFRALGRKINRPVWVTEQNFTPGAPRDRFEWSHAMKSAVTIHDLLVESDMALSLHFSYAASSEKGLVIYNPRTKTWARTYDVLKHLYNSVPVGSVRIGATPARTKGGVRATAFRSQGRLAAILVNPSRGACPVRLSAGTPIERVIAAHRSMSTVSYKPLIGLRVGDRKTVELDLPAQSVTSLILKMPPGDVEKP